MTLSHASPVSRGDARNDFQVFHRHLPADDWPLTERLARSQQVMRELSARWVRAQGQAVVGVVARRDLGNALCGVLAVHTALTLEVLLPALRERLDDEPPVLDLMQVEAELLQTLAARTAAADTDAPLRDAHMTLLGNLADMHLYREISDLHPLLRHLPDADGLGRRWAARQADLVARWRDAGPGVTPDLAFENEADDPVGRPPR